MKNYVRIFMGEQIKEKIIDGTCSLIFKNGFNNITADEISKESGIEPFLISSYFPTKEKLIRAAAGKIISNQPSECGSPADNLDTLKNNLKRFIDFFIHDNIKDVSSLKILMYAYIEGYTSPELFYLKREGTFLNWLYNSLHYLKEKGIIKTINEVAEITAFMIGLLSVLLQYAVIKNRSIDIDEFKTDLLDSFMDEIKIPV